MRATAGDQITISTRQADARTRAGQIVEVLGVDGGPPYVVHWADGGHSGLLFPGPDAQITPATSGHRQIPVPTSGKPKRWQVSLAVTGYGNSMTRAHVTAYTGAFSVQCYGEAHRRPDEADVPVIGDEVAAGRALIALGNELLRSAEQDLTRIEGRTVHVSHSPGGGVRH
jgi:hypothetical protein